MKVPQSIGDIYDARRPDFERLGRAAEDLIRGRLDRQWHFVGRVKTRESFALKVETGRVTDPSSMDDFYACTIVVRNMSEIAHGEAIVAGLFDVDRRRPERPNYMRSDPTNFDFDHLRLYMRWRDDDALPPSGLAGLPFEIQIKTYLQHAWAIATHDLVYKTDDVNWRKARIAYQVKAMLDHAETTIAHAADLAAIAELQITNDHIDDIRAVIGVLKSTWSEDPDKLPADIRRLAENVLVLLRSIRLTPTDLKTDLIAEQSEGRGSLIETLSPFGIVVQTLLLRHERAMRELLLDSAGRRDRRRRAPWRVVIPAEVEVPDSINPTDCRLAQFIQRIS